MPSRVVNGVILHIYGILIVAQSILVFTRIQKIDYSRPLPEIRTNLDRLRSGYLRAGVLIGFIWVAHVDSCGRCAGLRRDPNLKLTGPIADRGDIGIHRLTEPVLARFETKQPVG